MRVLIGIAIAGLPSVAMAYLSEEVHPDAIGGAMGLYITWSLRQR
jgi:MFS transporter, YNFM family, putative membrane transport protein